MSFSISAHFARFDVFPILSVRGRARRTGHTYDGVTIVVIDVIRNKLSRATVRICFYSKICAYRRQPSWYRALLQLVLLESTVPWHSSARSARAGPAKHAAASAPCYDSYYSTVRYPALARVPRLPEASRGGWAGNVQDCAHCPGLCMPCPTLCMSDLL